MRQGISQDEATREERGEAEYTPRVGNKGGKRRGKRKGKSGRKRRGKV